VSGDPGDLPVMIRFVLALAVTLFPAVLSAQTPPASQPPAAPQSPRSDRQAPAERDAVAPGPGPQERGSLDSASVRARLLDDLFGRLRAAPTSEDAQGIGEAIEAIWARTGSPTIDLMFAWFSEEMRTRNAGRAADYLDGIILLAPISPKPITAGPRSPSRSAPTVGPWRISSASSRSSRGITVL
jgi:hypothetical protein